MARSTILIPILAVIAVALLALTLVLGTISLRKTNKVASENRVFVACLTKWANQTAHRTSVLTGLNIQRQDALDAIIRDVAAGQSPKVDREALKAKFKDDIETYVVVSDQYNDALKEHPVPKAPLVACDSKMSKEKK